jgi:hypothetical protein
MYQESDSSGAKYAGRTIADIVGEVTLVEITFFITRMLSSTRRNGSYSRARHQSLRELYAGIGVRGRADHFPICAEVLGRG